jgi:hypothetical protein
VVKRLGRLDIHPTNLYLRQAKHLNLLNAGKKESKKYFLNAQKLVRKVVFAERL